MSDEMLGADLQHLQDLAAAFEAAGTEIAGKADQLRDKVDTCVDAFADALVLLKRDAVALTADIDVEIQGVGAQAAAVAWTGNNRDDFDTDLGAFTKAVNDGTAAINSDISRLGAEVDARFTPVLTEFGEALHDKGGELNTTAAGMRTAVGEQGANLEQAANVGWMSA